MLWELVVPVGSAAVEQERVAWPKERHLCLWLLDLPGASPEAGGHRGLTAECCAGAGALSHHKMLWEEVSTLPPGRMDRRATGTAERMFRAPE